MVTHAILCGGWSFRIAQICPTYYPSIGGVETHVREISVRLARRGLEVEVLTTDPSGHLRSQESIDGITVSRFRSWAPGKAYYFSPSLSKYLMRNAADYDILHAHNYHAFPALYAAQAKTTSRFVFTSRYHGAGHSLLRTALHVPYRLVGKGIFEKADMVVCLSQYEKKLLLSRFKIEPEKLTLIPNGIITRDFEHIKSRRDPAHRTILCVSRLEKYKGIDLLIRTLSLLDDTISLRIVGEGPYYENLVAMVHGLKLDDRVEFLKRLQRSQLLQMYADADVFVLLSRYEAFANVVAEALASGTRCIVAKSTALGDWVDNENCFGLDYPIEPRRAAILINEIIRDSSRNTARVHLLDWDEVVDRLEKIYGN